MPSSRSIRPSSGNSSAGLVGSRRRRRLRRPAAPRAARRARRSRRRARRVILGPGTSAAAQEDEQPDGDHERSARLDERLLRGARGHGLLRTGTPPRVAIRSNGGPNEGPDPRRPGNAPSAALRDAAPVTGIVAGFGHDRPRRAEGRLHRASPRCSAPRGGYNPASDAPGGGSSKVPWLPEALSLPARPAGREDAMADTVRHGLLPRTYFKAPRVPFDFRGWPSRSSATSSTGAAASSSARSSASRTSRRVPGLGRRPLPGLPFIGDVIGDFLTRSSASCGRRRRTTTTPSGRSSSAGSGSSSSGPSSARPSTASSSLRIARDEGLSFAEAFKFSAKNWLTVLLAPVIIGGGDGLLLRLQRAGRPGRSRSRTSARSSA